MKRKMSQCYLEERCNDPFPSDREDQARTKCFQEAKDRYTKEMQDCVRKNFPDYDMPSSGSGNRQWGQDVIRMKTAKCQAQDKKRFGNCMANAMQKVRGNNNGGGNNNKQQQQPKPDPCELRYQCYQKNMQQPCYDRQNDVKKELCTCAGRLNIQGYQSTYSGCMKAAGFTVDTNNDFNYASFNKIKDKFCKQTQDPCGGYTGRQAFGGKRSGNNNQPSSNNNGRGFNGGNNGNNGGFNGGPPNNGFNGGNNGNGGFGGGNSGSNGFNGGSNQNGGSGGDYNNYDLSSVGGDDDGFPSVNNVIGGGNTGSNFGGGAPDLSTLVGSSNTGLDPSSFLGGGALGGGALGGSSLVPSTGGGGLFSQFTGGSGGGLLSSFTGGNAGGSSILDAFSGGFDPSTIFSGKKK